MQFDGKAFIAALVTAGLSYFAWDTWTKYQAIRNTPRSTVRSIAIGTTELHGDITTEEPLEAPLTGEPAVAYHYSIDADDGDHHHTVEQGRDGTRAVLTDDTGSVTVDLDGVTIEDGHDYHEDIGTFDNPSDRLKEQLNDMDVDHTGWFGGNRDLTFSETRIEPDDTVYLLGTARDNPGVDDGTATTSTDDLIIEAADNQFLIANSDEASLRTTEWWQAIPLVALAAASLIVTATYILIG